MLSGMRQSSATLSVIILLSLIMFDLVMYELSRLNIARTIIKEYLDRVEGKIRYCINILR